MIRLLSTIVSLLACNFALADFSSATSTAPISVKPLDISGWTALAQTTDPDSTNISVVVYPTDLNVSLINTEYSGSTKQWTFALKISGKDYSFPAKPNSLLIVFGPQTLLSIPLKSSELLSPDGKVDLGTINKTLQGWISKSKN